MVARGDAVLLGLVGIMTLYIGASATVAPSYGPGLVPLVFLFAGLGLFILAIVLYFIAPPAPWSPQSSGTQALVTLACPVFGTPLAWVDEVKQWYCPRCQAYHGAKPT